MRAERADTQATCSRRRCRFRLNHTVFPGSRDDYLRGEAEDGKKVKEATQRDIAVTVMSVVMLHAQEAGDISETRRPNNAPTSRHAPACPTLRGVYNCNCKCNPCENDSPGRRYKIRLRAESTATAITRALTLRFYCTSRPTDVIIDKGRRGFLRTVWQNISR